MDHRGLINTIRFIQNVFKKTHYAQTKQKEFFEAFVTSILWTPSIKTEFSEYATNKSGDDSEIGQFDFSETLKEARKEATETMTINTGTANPQKNNKNKTGEASAQSGFLTVTDCCLAEVYIFIETVLFNTIFSILTI